MSATGHTGQAQCPAQGLHARMDFESLVCPSTHAEPRVSALVPRPMTWLLSLLQENLQIHLKSTQGPIEVYLCPEEVQEPHSPAKEPLPSTSALSPSPDSTQLNSNSDPGITEPTASSGETRDRRWGGAPAFKSSSSVSAFVGYPPSTHVCALHVTLYKAHTRSLSQRED